MNGLPLPLPLSSSDLKAIAEALGVVETNEAVTENAVIGRIEVMRPDGNDVVGFFQREGNPDGSGEAWFGFVGGGFL